MTARAHIKFMNWTKNNKQKIKKILFNVLHKRGKGTNYFMVKDIDKSKKKGFKLKF